MLLEIFGLGKALLFEAKDFQQHIQSAASPKLSFLQKDNLTKYNYFVFAYIRSLQWAAIAQ